MLPGRRGRGLVFRTVRQTGRAPAVWALFGFLVTFAMTRWITRRSGPRSRPAEAARTPARNAEKKKGGFSDIYIGGVHVHHQVWGIMLVLVSGMLEFRFNPGIAVERGARRAVRRRRGARAGRVRAVVPPRRRVLGRGGPQVDRRRSSSARCSGSCCCCGQSLRGGRERWTSPAPGATRLTIAFNMAMCRASASQGQDRHGPDRHPDPAGVGLIGAIRLAKPASHVGAPTLRGQAAPTGWSGRTGSFDDAYQRRRDRMRDFLGGTPSTKVATPEPTRSP